MLDLEQMLRAEIKSVHDADERRARCFEALVTAATALKRISIGAGTDLAHDVAREALGEIQNKLTRPTT
jgi:hypothetical protein